MPYATQHNGGRIQINPNFSGMDQSWANRWINIQKSAQDFDAGNTLGFIPPRYRDANGYPKKAATDWATANGATITNLGQTWTQAQRPGKYILKFNGYAYLSLYVNWGGERVEIDTTATGGTNNRIVVTPGPTDNGLFGVWIYAVGAGGISDLRVCHEEDEGMLDAGVIWQPGYIARLKRLNPGRIRSMNWQQGNQANLSNWVDRTPKDFITWGSGNYFKPSLDYGMTSNSGGAYSIGSTGRGALKHGEVLHASANTPNPYTDIPCTITNANPGQFSTGATPHNIPIAAPVGVTSLDKESRNFNSQRIYYVATTGYSATGFQLALTPGGTALTNVGDTTSSQMFVTRQCTFTRDGLPALPLLTEYGTVLRADTHGPNWTSSRTYLSTFIYDDFVKAWFFYGNGRWDKGFSGDLGIINWSVPFEVFMDLCATVGAHPMFSGFTEGTYPSTGLHKDMAQATKDWCAANGITWMKPHFEGPNELWNWPLFGLTTTSRYVCRNYYRTNGNAPDYHNPYGWAMAEIGQEVAAVYGGDRSKYDVGIGVQTSSNPADSNPRANSDQWMAQGSAPSGYVLQPAKNFATTVVTAQYITSPSSVGGASAVELQQQTDYAAGDTSQLGLYLDGYDDGTNVAFNITFVDTKHKQWKAWAIFMGIYKICGYEGGYSPDYKSESPTRQLRADAKSYSKPTANFPGGIYHVDQRNFDRFFALNDGSFVAEYPSVFQLEGPNPSTNAWSIQEDMMNPDSEQLKTYALLSNGKRRYTAKVH